MMPQGAARILTGLVALEHLAFLWLEMFAWRTPLGLRVFKLTPAAAEASAVLAANQGLYNGFLAAGLLWSLRASDPGRARDLQTFFLSCVILAGAYGGGRVFLIQALPALLALALR